jgi:protein gp37
VLALLAEHGALLAAGLPEAVGAEIGSVFEEGNLMGDNTGIEWCDATWNPVVGCSVISPGCTHCYAMKMASRLEKMGSPIYRGMTKDSKAGAVWTGEVAESNWGQMIRPLSWKKPRRIFANSMSDLFHKDMPAETIERVFTVMALTQRHTYQALTKRADRMLAEVTRIGKSIDILERHARDMGYTLKFEGHGLVKWPLPNVWLGVSVEDQARADERIPLLLETPAAKRFLSCEPLLGPVDLHDVIPDPLAWNFAHGFDGIDWVIVGGESGPNARPMHPEWAMSLRDQCTLAGTAFFFKQWGEWTPGVNVERQRGTVASAHWFDNKWIFGNEDLARDDGHIDDEPDLYRVGKKAAGRLLDGREHSEFPA